MHDAIGAGFLRSWAVPERDGRRRQPDGSGNVIITQNDYRFGDGRCGVDWSMDGGRTWGSQLAPSGFTAPGFTAPRHYWDAGGDTSVGFDSTGEAYLMCQVFNRGTTSDLGGDASAFFLFRSADGGASWSFPGRRSCRATAPAPTASASSTRST